MKQRLTDRTSQALKPQSKPYELMDADVRGLGIRILPSGVKSFVMIARFPPAQHPARRALGQYPELTLAQARERARLWRELL
jgi:Arm DNA-binding domain